MTHRYAEKRNATGHFPGYVYLLALAKGTHKISKCENTKIETDDFDLNETDERLLILLKERLKGHQKDKDRPHYNDFGFIHAIRVACGEGGENHPSIYLGRRKGKSEMFHLSEEDINAFKNITDELLGYPIKHLSTADFAAYLEGIGEHSIQVSR